MTTPCPTLGTLLLERMLIRLITEGGKGGSRSRFTENKTVLSQFTKNNAMIKITVHGELNIYFSFQGK